MLNVEQNQTGFHDPSTESELLSELQDLSNSPGFIYALAHAAAADSFIKPDAPSNPVGRLSVKELTLAAGLFATHTIDKAHVPDEQTLGTLVNQFYFLLQKLHQVVGQPMSEGTMSRVRERLSGSANQEDMPMDLPHGPEMVEPFFYVGTGAYDFQYLDLAGEKYSYDSGWLASNVGMSMDSLTRAARALLRLRESRFPSYLESQTLEERCRVALATLSFTRNDLDFLTDNEFSAFITKFAVIPGGVKHGLNSVGDINELEFKPIIRLAEDDFFMPVGFMLSKAIYESPFFWMMSDGSYWNQASNNRGRATEEMAMQLLSPIFGNNIYRNVAVVETGSKRTVPHEIDVLAFVGNRAIAIQAKSKRLTVLSRQGDDKQVKEDFSLAVQEAYQQGLASRKLLLGGEYTFLNQEGNPINLPDPLEDAYVVCLTLDHFPALPYITQRFLKKEHRDPFPVTMSILDLDMLATYLTDPFEFLHYIYQRSRWFDHIIGSCEASFLGCYLTRGLALPQEVALASLTESMAGLIDEDFPSIRGRNQILGQHLNIASPNAAIGGLKNRWHDNVFQPFISLLKNSLNPGATDALFDLFDLPKDAVSFFQHKVEEAIRNCKLTSEISSCFVLLEGRKGISFVSVPDSPSHFEDFLHSHASALKYKHKADRLLGLGVVLATSHMAVVFSREPWQTDAELDELARELLQPDTQKSKPGRNQLCWCGSEKKYKKCHL